MTTYTIASGYDTYALAASPTKNFGEANSLLSGSGSAAATYVYFPLPAEIIGATIAHAQIRGAQVSGTFFSQTIQTRLVTSSWSESTLTNNNQPSTGTLTSAAITSGPVDFIVGVTTQIQAVAAGTPWFGLQLVCTTSQLTFNSFESGTRTWILTIDTTTAPEVPQSLVPNGTVVGSGAPVLTCDFIDNGGLTNDMAAMQVQISTSTSFTSPVFDSGTFATTVPVYDLAAGGFTPVSSGTTRWWRVQVQDTDGNWSGFSDPASFTFRTQPTITINTPAAGVVYDPTTDINATTSTNLSAYRVQITDGSDQTAVRFDSGRLAANPSALTTVDVPLPQEYEGSRVLVDGSTYQLHIRVWDTFTSRQSTPGSPSYVDSWSTFVFADDAGVTAPTTLVVDQAGIGPAVTLTWTRAAVPDGWVILRDNKVINRSDGTDVIAGVSTYSWVDSFPSPWVNHDYKVKAVTMVSGKPHQSQPSPVASLTPDIKGVWIYTQDGQQIILDDTDMSQLTVNDRATSYKPINLRYDVDILTGFEGTSGQITGVIPSGLDDSVSLSDATAVLLSIKDNPSQWVRLVYGNFSGRVLLRNVAILPDPRANVAVPLSRVSFGVNQVGDFDSVS